MGKGIIGATEATFTALEFDIKTGQVESALLTVDQLKRTMEAMSEEIMQLWDLSRSLKDSEGYDYHNYVQFDEDDEETA